MTGPQTPRYLPTGAWNRVSVWLSVNVVVVAAFATALRA